MTPIGSHFQSGRLIIQYWLSLHPPERPRETR
jgi:hypothetical protein